MGWSKEGKVKLLIKAYLTLNKNRKITSKEIATWINSNNFGMNNTMTHPNMVTLLVKVAIRQGEQAFKDVHLEKDKITQIWMD